MLLPVSNNNFTVCPFILVFTDFLFSPILISLWDRITFTFVLKFLLLSFLTVEAFVTDVATLKANRIL